HLALEEAHEAHLGPEGHGSEAHVARPVVGPLRPPGSPGLAPAVGGFPGGVVGGAAPPGAPGGPSRGNPVRGSMPTSGGLSFSSLIFSSSSFLVLTSLVVSGI